MAIKKSWRERYLRSLKTSQETPWERDEDTYLQDLEREEDYLEDGTTISIFIFGRRSTVYSCPR